MKMKLNFQSDPDMCSDVSDAARGAVDDRVIAKITPLREAGKWRAKRRRQPLGNGPEDRNETHL